jgi:YidC/Oxa1 family membrane protein insertase
MEKRTLVAFALSFLILILWSTLFAPSGKQPPPQREPSQAEQSQPAVQPAPEAAPSETVREPAEVSEAQPVSPTPQAQIKEQEIRVETPLYTARWSNVGGSLMSFELKEYRETTEPGSPPINLANVDGLEGGMLRFGFEAYEAAESPPILYEPSETFLQVGPESGPKDLVIKGKTPQGLTQEVTYRFHPDQYRIDVETRVVNRTAGPLEGAVSARLRNRPPKGKKSYYGFVGIALLLNGELEEIKPKKMDDEEKRLSGRIGWMAYEDDYFMSAVAPSDTENGRFRGKLLPSGAVNARYFSPLVRLRTGEQTSARFALYFGPRDLTVLNAFGENLPKAVNFGWTDVIAKPLLHVLCFFNKYVQNFGFSILILTVLIKILFWPLTHKSYKSMKEMQKIQPLMAKLREKYKDNKEQMNRELMQLYKTYKVNPMGGCLPMLIQIPVFLALFRVLSSSIELRHAPFLFWIDDLSAPDRLFHFPFDIPFMAPPSGIPVLTLLMGASMFLQQKMSPSPGDPTQAKVMMFLPLIFTFVFINFPSGLVLYWLTNNILSIGQQYRILKKSN